MVAYVRVDPLDDGDCLVSTTGVTGRIDALDVPRDALLRLLLEAGYRVQPPS